MKKLLLIVTFALAMTGLTLQADPPLPGCPDICQTVPGN